MPDPGDAPYSGDDVEDAPYPGDDEYSHEYDDAIPPDYDSTNEQYDPHDDEGEGETPPDEETPPQTELPTDPGEREGAWARARAVRGWGRGCGEQLGVQKVPAWQWAGGGADSARPRSSTVRPAQIEPALESRA